MAWNYKNIAKNVLWLASNDGLNFLSMTLYSVAILRILGADQMAWYSSAFIITPIFRTICDGGFDIGLVRDLPIMKNPLAHVVFAQKSKTILWLFCLPIALALFAINGFGFSFLYGLFAILILLINLLTETYVGVFRAFSNAGYISKVLSKFTVAEYLFAFGLILTIHNLSVPLITIVIFEIAKLFTAKRQSYKQYFSNYNRADINTNLFSKGIFKEIFINIKSNNLSLIIYYFLDSLYYRIPVIALTYFSSNFEISAYASSQKFLTALRTIPGAVLYVLTPEFTKNKEKFNFKPFIALALLISVALFFSSDVLINLTYKLKESIDVLKVMSVFFFFFFIRFIFEAKIFAIKKEKVLIWLTMAALTIFFISLNVLSFSALNASLALLISELFLFISIVITLKRFNRINAPIDRGIDVISSYNDYEKIKTTNTNYTSDKVRKLLSYK